MNSAQLLEHFDRISEAPDAVTRLRRFILDLAVRGKLVEQDDREEPAVQLLNRVQAEKSRLVKEGLIKKEKLLPAIEAAELSFNVPPGWTNVRLINLCILENGDRSKNYPSRDEMVPEGIPFINAGHLEAGVVNLDEMNFITGERFGILNGGKVKEGDLLYCLRGSLGKIALVSGIERGAIASSLVIIRLVGQTSVRFMLRYFDSTLSYEMIKRFDNGTAQPNLSSADLGKFIVPLPPIAEQHRIVAKVDELMALCDQLETAQNKRESRRDRLIAASLHRIGTATADEAATETQPTTLPEAASFHLDHLPRLTTRPEHIKQLRQTILGLIFHGCLTSRLDEDGLGIDLVNEIHSQCEAEEPTKTRVGKSKLTAKFECGPAFSAPETWGWTRLQLLCEQIGDIDHKMPRAVSVGVPFLSAKDLKDNGELDFSDPKHISEEDFTRLSRKILPKRDDIIYSRIGAKLGKARLVEVDTRFLISYSCCLIRPKHQFVDKRFLQIFLDSHLALRQAHSGVQSIGVPDLGLGEIKDYRIPIPPLAEQHRIVAKVDELMALCDQLETQLNTTQADSRRLLEALLHEALSPRQEEVA